MRDAASDPMVQVLLSTWNGSAYLPELLDSLAAQTSQSWSLLVRDDGSRDRTGEILEDWASRHPGRLVIVPNPAGANLGVVGSFSRLLEASSAPYVMFADQDDVWAPEKIALTRDGMRRREAEAGAARPILVHTDLMPVDSDLTPISESYWTLQGIVPDRGHALSRMLVENIASGCTMMLNRPLVDRVGAIPEEAALHDWWISLVASAFGDIVSLPARPILWRRHGANVSETTDLRRVLLSAVAGAPAMRRRVARLFEDGQPRARSFLERYRGELKPEERQAVGAFLGLLRLNPLARRASILRHGLLFTSRLRNAGLLALI